MGWRKPRPGRNPGSLPPYLPEHLSSPQASGPRPTCPAAAPPPAPQPPSPPTLQSRDPARNSWPRCTRTQHCTFPVLRDRPRLQASHREGAQHRGAAAAARRGGRPARAPLPVPRPRARAIGRRPRDAPPQPPAGGCSADPAVLLLAAPCPAPRAPHLPRARALLPRPPATLLEPPPPPPAARPALARDSPCPAPAPVPASHWPPLP